MTYFIVEAPYEKCFDFFFQTEFGYPNFYRMTELLSSHERYSHLVLVAPYQTKEPEIVAKIAERVEKLGIHYLPFGEHLETAFSFDPSGSVQIHPDFKETLNHKVLEFLEKRSAQAS